MQITGNYASGEDLLAFVDQNGITGVWNATNGTLTLSGSATLAQYEAALRSITFENTSNSPSTATRTVSFTVNDGDDNSNTLTRDIAFTAVNDAPVEAAIEGTPLAYTENDGAVAITSSIAITDVDDTNIESAVVQITSNYVNGEDLLAFVDQNGITGSWNATNGTLTLSGSATLAQYEAALRGVTFENTSEDPSTATRTVSFTVHDGDANSNTLTRDIDVAAVNDEQQLVVNETLAISEGGSGLIDAAHLQTTDLDHSASSLVYTVTADALHGTLYRSATPLSTGATFTQTDVDLGLISYLHDGGESTSDSIDLSVDDGVGASTALTFLVSITPVNDAPDITSNGGTANASINIPENSTAVTTVQALDVDLPPNTLTYSISGGADAARFQIDGSTGVLRFIQAPNSSASGYGLEWRL
ncbi:MAG: cadherin-like domain-containing protein [Pirellulaceae bacterium]